MRKQTHTKKGKRWLLSLLFLVSLWLTPSQVLGWGVQDLGRGSWNNSTNSYDNICFEVHFAYAETYNNNSAWKWCNFYVDYGDGTQHYLCNMEDLWIPRYSSDDPHLEDFRKHDSWVHSVEFGDKGSDNESYTKHHGWICCYDPYYTGAFDYECWCWLRVVLDRRLVGSGEITFIAKGKWVADAGSGYSAEKSIKIPYKFDKSVSNPTLGRHNKGITFNGNADNVNNYSYWVDFYQDNYAGNPVKSSSNGTNNAKGIKLDGFDNWMPYTYKAAVRHRRPNWNIGWQDNMTVTNVVSHTLGDLSVGGLPRPDSVLVAPYDVTRKQMRISWNNQFYDENRKYDDGVWKVWRENNGHRVYVGATSSANETSIIDDNTKDGDNPEDHNNNGLHFDQDYKYVVIFSPKGWSVSTENDAEGLWGTKDITFERDFEFQNLRTTSTEHDITFLWEHSSISDASNLNSYKLTVQRSKTIGEEAVWEDMAREYTITNANTTEGKYVDNDPSLELYQSYYYRLHLYVQDKDFYSDPVAGKLAGSTEITSFKASRGTYEESVNLVWNVKQLGSNDTHFELSRRPLGSNDDYAIIYKTAGTAALYTFNDETALPGSYYQYNLRLYTYHNGAAIDSNPVQTDGFCSSPGVISGRISYGTGTAVEGVKVILNANDADGELKNNFRSISMLNKGAGIQYGLDNDGMRKLIKGKDFSLQMYLRPEIPDTVSAARLVSIPGALDVLLTPVDSVAGLHSVSVMTGDSVVSDTKMVVDNGFWSHLTLSYNQEKKQLTTSLAYYIGKDQDSAMVDQSVLDNVLVSIPDDTLSLTIGNNVTFSDPESYKGYVDEFRFWTKALTKADIEKNFYRTLSGKEKELAIYWPLDEGMEKQIVAYDLSSTNDVSNERHANVRLCKSSVIVPDNNQLSVSAVTDGEGNYVLRGVPFSGNGTNYSITPQMGIHRFSPSCHSRYLSTSSRVHSGVDFTDVSSFPVSGRVLYEGTSIPVEGANIYVDNAVCSKNGEALVTKSNGEFTVDVPIGDHSISIKKQGHTFMNNGRWPADPDNVGTTKTFERAFSGVNFYDQTKVVIAGRVAGGQAENDKALGVGLGNANIGRAQITLSFVGSSYDGYWLNAVKDSLSNYDISQTRHVYEGASPYIKSHAYVEGGKNVITILTDSLTGEYSALVPPLIYESTSITIPSQPEISFKNLLFSMDASNPLYTTTDSADVVIDKKKGTTELRTFEYCAAEKTMYRSSPVLDVTENQDGSFGDETYVVVDRQDQKHNVELYTVKEDGSIDYTFGYPVYQQKATYRYKLSAYETYCNKDQVDPRDWVKENVPLPNITVTIKNQFASTSCVVTSSHDVQYSVGDVYEMEDNKMQLDSLGRGTYLFRAGMPNIQGEHTRGLSISYSVDGEELSWSGNNTFRAIILGGLPKGTNFVTQGPDEIMMVLRDPPGTGSSTTWSKGTSINKTVTRTFSRHSNTEFLPTIALGANRTLATGSVEMMMIDQMESIFNIELGYSINYSEDHNNTTSTTITTTKDISTSDGPDFVGAVGDLFIGSAKNIILGACTSVDIAQRSDSFVVVCGDALMMGEEFTTQFCYTQNYIQNVLIPQFETVRNSILIHVDSPAEIDSYPRPTNGVPVYLTTLDPEEDADKFGSPNDDVILWGNSAVEWSFESLPAMCDRIIGPSYSIVFPTTGSYSDTIQFFNNQIDAWVTALSRNEQQKVICKENRSQMNPDNYSFDAGAGVSKAVERSRQHSTEESTTHDHNFHTGIETGLNFDGVGVKIQVTEDAGMTYFNTEVNDTTWTESISFTLAEDGDDDYLSVDVYEHPKDNYGPIFYTRAGATSAPYEDEVVTRYYKPGTVISERTLQIEKPELEILNPIITGVPAGKDAVFRAMLRNNSETGEDCYYGIWVNPESNPDGAQVFMDGQNITAGVDVLVPAGEIQKTFVLRQTDPDILEYHDISLSLYSTSQPDDTGVFPGIYSDASLSVYFQPTCSDINLEASSAVVNTNSEEPLMLSMSGYDYNQATFQKIRLQYKGENDANFVNLQTYVKDTTLLEGDSTLLPFKPLSGIAKLNYSVDLRNSMYTDQTYVFRAQTVGVRNGAEVTNESEEIRVVRDMNSPQLITMPTPTNGILTASDNITLTFNEDIRSNQLTKIGNFIVTGEMNETEIVHDVALSLTGDGIAKTESTFDLAQKSFSVNIWVNYTHDGRLLQHGSADYNFSLSIEDGKLIFAIGEEKAVSTLVLPQDKWIYLAVSYDCSGETPIVNAGYGKDASTYTLIYNQPMTRYEGNGPLSLGGNGLEAKLQELTLWSEARTLNEAISDMYVTKNQFTNGLIGYWQLNEGHGTLAIDRSRSRNLLLPADNAWYLASGVNYALNLDGETTVIAKAGVTMLPTESYLIETWFQAVSGEQGVGSILSFSDRLDLRLNANGALELGVNGSYTTAYSAKNLYDGQWHHVALNVLKSNNGSAILYLDAKPVRQFSASSMPYVVGRFILGAKENTAGNVSTYSQHLTGAIDEVRVWRGSRTSGIIENNMYTHVNAGSEGLVAYYPMEKRELDEYSQEVVRIDKTDQSGMGGAIAVSDNAIKTTQLALSNAPSLDNVQFNFVASDRQITISLDEQPYKVENCNVNLTVRNVQDINGNKVQPITWTIYVQQNHLKWDETEKTIAVTCGKTETFSVDIENLGAISDGWTLSGLPTWLTVNAESGVLAPLATQNLRFTVSPSLSVGNYEATIYLTGNQNINAPLYLQLKVKGEEPDWNPVPDEESMAIVGQIEVDGVMSTDEGDMLAAFRGQTCVGMARPAYSARYDAYIVMMNVYGNGEHEGAKLNYKFYDASTGTVYPAVTVSDPAAYTFHACAWVGTFDDRAIFTPENKIEQSLSLAHAGWKWFSMYAIPDDNTMAGIFNGSSENIAIIKSFSASALNTEGRWTGTLTQLDNQTMYKLKATAAFEDATIGVPVNPVDVSISLVGNGWTWIGYPAQSRNSLDNAFADADPQEGDVVLGQSLFAMYAGGEWVGSLTSMVPGEGYKYYNMGQTKTFHFQTPVVTGNIGGKPAANNVLTLNTESNMALIAHVEDAEGNLVIDASIEVYADGKLCGYSAQSDAEGRHFVTIGGDNATHSLVLVVRTSEGEEYSVADAISYCSNSVVGSVDEPKVIVLGAANGIDTLRASKPIAHIALYDAAGNLIQSLSAPQSLLTTQDLSGLIPGVYLQHVTYSDGQAIVIKHVK